MATKNDSSTTKAIPDFEFDFAVLGGVLTWLQMIAWATEQDAGDASRVRHWASLANFLSESFGTTAEGMRERAEDFQLLTKHACNTAQGLPGFIPSDDGAYWITNKEERAFLDAWRALPKAKQDAFASLVMAGNAEAHA